jgi:hypothetical protein
MQLLRKAVYVIVRVKGERMRGERVRVKSDVR